MTTTARPTPPELPTLRQAGTSTDDRPVYATPDGRFRVTRNARFELDGYTVIDTAGAGLLGHDGDTVRVWEIDDARALIRRRVLLPEWRRAAQAWDRRHARTLAGSGAR